MERREKIGSAFDKILDYIFIFLQGILAFFTIGICIDVCMRYFFNKPIPWMDEFSGYGLVFITFLGAAWVLRKDGHVRIDIISSLLSQRTRALIDVITSILFAIALLPLIGYGAWVTWDSFQRGLYMPTPTEIPTGFILVVMPIGFFLLFIELLRRTIPYFENKAMK
jgi:TRAP-type C4-dicarboxylate transport system permease small subunit